MSGESHLEDVLPHSSNPGSGVTYPLSPRSTSEMEAAEELNMEDARRCQVNGCKRRLLQKYDKVRMTFACCMVLGGGESWGRRWGCALFDVIMCALRDEDTTATIRAKN